MVKEVHWSVVSNTLCPFISFAMLSCRVLYWCVIVLQQCIRTCHDRFKKMQHFPKTVSMYYCYWSDIFHNVIHKQTGCVLLPLACQSRLFGEVLNWCLLCGQFGLYRETCTYVIFKADWHIFQATVVFATSLLNYFYTLDPLVHSCCNVLPDSSLTLFSVAALLVVVWKTST